MRAIPPHCLALVLALFAGLASGLPAAELRQGTDFQYQVEGTSLVAWTDPEFPEGHFGTPVRIEGEGIQRPATLVTGVHVGPLGFRASEEPGWLEDVELSVSWAPSDKAHCLDLTIEGRNKTKRRLAFRDQAPSVWLGPIGAAGTDRYALQTIYGYDGNEVDDYAVGTELSKDMRWLAVTDRYEARVLELLEGPGRFQIEALPGKTVPPGGAPGVAFSGKVLVFKLFDELQAEEEFRIRMRVFAGLKTEDNLRPGGYLGLFDTWGGMTGWISYLVFLLLQWLHALTNNWGVSIILLTVMIKVALYPLSRKQIRSMAKMQELQPRIQALQTRYADNPQRMQAEVTKLWAEAGVNPLSGCLPLLAQLPIFIALYNCLSYVPELRGVDFLWLTDLSKPDPMWILPFLFALGIYVSSSQNVSDPSQKTMMQVMPVMMFLFMVNIPAGVMIYLAGQTILSIFEQRLNKGLKDQVKTEGPAPGDDAAAPGKGPDRVIDNDEAGEVRKATGNKYKQARKGRRKEGE